MTDILSVDAFAPTAVPVVSLPNDPEDSVILVTCWRVRFLAGTRIYCTRLGTA